MENKMKKQYLIIDFDSTFITKEGLDVLAEVALMDFPDKKVQAVRLEQIKALTHQGMEGKLSLSDSLAKRLNLLTAQQKHIPQAVAFLQQHITPSFLRNKTFFTENYENIFIISGGFKELIVPVVALLGIPANKVFANTLVLDANENIVGADIENPLSRNGGKAQVVQALGLEGEFIILGDGMTDLEIRDAIPGSTFVAFTENVARDAVMQRADVVVNSFDVFLQGKHFV